MIIYWATKLRGFLKHMSQRMDAVSFVGNEQYYEISGIVAKAKSMIVRSKLFDLIGLFQIIRVSDKQCDYYGSFNRFLSADKPYFIYLENPTALYHYSLGRLRLPAGRKRFSACLEDKNLKAIVCMSHACKDTFEKVNMPLPAGVKLLSIYPFVPANPHATPEQIEKKSSNETLECLYCVQGKRFVTKGGVDVVKAVSDLIKTGKKIHLTIITNVSALDADTRKMIEQNDSITLHDFGFDYQEMEKIYASTNILLQPSSDESFGLTVLEAMKGGCAVVASRMYAFPEMVEEQKNGILMDPKYWMFTPDNIPNPKAWAYKKKVQLAKRPDEKYKQNIEAAILELYEDREKLYRYAQGSLDLANGKFGEETIQRQWETVWNTLKGEQDDET